MGDKFKHIGDFFKEQSELSPKPKIVPTKKFEDMTPDNQMEYLIEYCARSGVWARSTKKLDREFFISLHEKYDGDWNDVKSVIEFKEKFYIELDKQGRLKNHDMRRGVRDTLPKFVASKRAKANDKKPVKQGSNFDHAGGKNLPVITRYTTVKCSTCKKDVPFCETVTGVSVNDRICNDCVPAACSLCKKIKVIGEMTPGNKIGEMFCRECAVNADVTCVKCREVVKAVNTIPGRKFGEIICKPCVELQSNQN